MSSTPVALPADVQTVVGHLHELAEGAAVKMREKHAEADREHGIPRWGETYFAGYLHGVCAAIATATGEQSDQIALRYEELTP